MSASYGKLILLQTDGPEQEFDLAKSTITLGRAMTNDIILSDARTSRSHARLECTPQGCTLVDLGSSNGTRLNGLRVEKTSLKPGDVLSLGNSQLRFESASPIEEIGLTQIDTDAQLSQTLDIDFLPVAINETGQPRLVVFTPDKTWEIPLEDVDQAVIGREDTCTVFIDSPKASRHHAEIERKGDIFLLKDLGSTNGTWFHGERVETLILQDGDAFRIGPANIVFKSGFHERNLTIAEDQLTRRQERRTVVFVPGLMGSELWLGNERVWPNVKTIVTHPEIFRYSPETRLEPRGIVDEVVIVPNLIKQDQYNRLGDYLVEELHYRRHEDFFEFAYDWRQDVRISARQLGQLIETLPTTQPIVIIAHSLGTMVSRYYIERLGGKKRIERAILMGGPHNGAVKGLTSMLVSPQVLPFGIMGERLRQIMMSFPTSYQILPTYHVGKDQNGIKINFLEDGSWLPEEYLPLLHMAREFRREMGSKLSIPSISIFGYGIKTIQTVSVVRDAGGKLQKVDYKMAEAGDATILEQSAVMQGSEIHPVRQYHGSLFVDNDVKMRLKLELTRTVR